jgi:hypothetical protein
VTLTTWIHAGGGNFDTPSDWSTGAVPGPLDDALIDGDFNITTVSDETVNSLTVSDGAGIFISAGTFTALNGVTVSGGGIVARNGSTLKVHGSITNFANFVIYSDTSTTKLLLAGQVIVSDYGTFFMSGSNSETISDGVNASLILQDGRVAGAGSIGDNHLTLTKVVI